MATLQLTSTYCGVPNTARGEASHISCDPSGNTDDFTYASGRVAVVRSLADPLAVRVFSLHSAPVTCARFAPDGLSIASGDEAGSIRLWAADTLVQKADIYAMAGPVRDIVFSPDQKFLACCGDSRTAYAKVFKLPSGGSAGVCQGHTKRALAIDVSPTKPCTLVTASEDMSVGLFKGPPVREIDIAKFLRHHTGFINDVRFSPDGKYIAVASSDRSISIIDPASHELVTTINGHAASVTAVCWTADGTKLFSSSNDKTTKLWDIPSGNLSSTVTFGKDISDMQVGCAISRKGSEFISVSLRSEIKIFDSQSSTPKTIFRGHAKQIVGISTVAEKVYSADYSGLMVAWDIGTGPSDLSFNGKGPTGSVCAIAANDEFVANVGQDGKIFITPTTSLTYAKPITVKGGGVGIAVPRSSSVGFSAIMINETRMVAVNAAADDVTAELKFSSDQTGCCVGVAQDGSLIAIGLEIMGGSGELRFYTLNGSTFVQKGDTIRMPSPPNRIAFSPEGDIVALGEKSRRVKFYDASTGTSIQGGGIGHSARVDAITFSPDGTKVASGGMDSSVAVWPVKSEEEPVKLKTAHRSGVTGIGFISSTSIVTSGGDSCLRTWTL